MTPAALTPAARKTSSRARKSTGRGGSAAPRTPTRAAASAAPRSSSRPAAKTSHRSPLRPGLTPRAPRRVSGPLGGLTRGRARAATAAPAPSSTPRRSGIRRPAPRRPPFRAGEHLSPAARAAAYVRALPDHSLLDRIIRGRVWIPLLGVLLAGIVAMQVEVLKLNAATGVSLQRTTSLQNERDVLQADVAQLSDDQRIESLAAQMGLQMPAPSQVSFLSTGGGAANQAVTNIHQPNPTSFLAALPGAQTTGGVDTGAAPVSAATTDPTAAAGTTPTGAPATTAGAPSATTVAPSTTAVAPSTTTGAPSTTAVASAPTPVAPVAPTTSTPATGG